MTNKKKIYLFTIIIFLLSALAFCILFYCDEKFTTKKEDNTTFDNNLPPLPSLVPDDFYFNVPVEDFMKPVTDKITSTIISQKVIESPVKIVPITTSTSTPTTSSTSTTIIIKSSLPPESPVDYKDNGNGTITDNYTNLMWSKCTQGNTGKDCSGGSPSLREWSKSRSECEALKLASKTGWRLPTLKELEFLVDSASFNPAINKTFFPNTSSAPYWTSTSPAQYTASKFTVLFSDGSVYFKDGGNFASTRCVRANI